MKNYREMLKDLHHKADITRGNRERNSRDRNEETEKQIIRDAFSLSMEI